MSHNVSLVCGNDKLVKGVGFNSGAHSCVNIFLEIIASVVINIFAVLNNSLVAAASDCKVYSGCLLYTSDAADE